MAKKSFQKILVIGMGKVGSLVALLLKEAGFTVTGMDHNPGKAHGIKILAGDTSDKQLLKKILSQNDAVVSCLPFHANILVARAAHQAGKHYFDLTEDVATTEAIRALSRSAKGVMAPQCGLAPGFIAIAGASIARDFKKLRSIELRVGALPQHPKGLLGYAFNWSPEGVVNEYLNDCIVIKRGDIKQVPSMQDLETIVIGGLKLEAFTTSGGLGTMCETYLGKVNELNYKTLRYPGHCKLMKFFFNELLMHENPKKAGEILVHAKPPVHEDVVYVHAAAEGWKNKHLERDEFVRAYFPVTIDGTQWRAISWTTAASVVAVVELVASGKLPRKGFIKQESIALEDFLATKAGKYYQNAQ